jgi:protein tyrosine phosphatase (PTP) superfamily phosphohydrolase (DUF442 family)
MPTFRIIFAVAIGALPLVGETNAPGVKALRSNHLENVFSIEEKIFSGSSPHDEQGFQELKALGVKTIISVDGGKPDVEAARKYGMRYIHIPIGYDGTTLSNASRIAKAADTADGAVYVHCHHGKHRGPAAVAVICESRGIWSASQGEAWLKQAGTSPDYPGLYRMAATFHKSADYSKIPASFPERAAVSGLVDAMVEVDLRWGHLKAVQKAGYKVPPDHPDLVPEKEAILLMEAYRELARVKEARALGADFLDRLIKAEEQAASLHAFLKNGKSLIKEQADALWKNAGQACSSCHKKYRN